MSASHDFRRAFSLRDAGVYYALLLLVAVLAFASAVLGRPNYFSAINLTNIVYQASSVAIMGVAMTVVLITGNFDLSVASVAALAAAVHISIISVVGFWPALVIAVAVAMLVGILNGVMVQYVGINAFIVTLGTLTAIRGLVLIVTNGRSLMVDSPQALAAMTGFESGRAAAYWPMIVVGAVLALAGLVTMLRVRQATPARVGAMVGGAVLIGLALLAGPTLGVANPVLYMIGFTLVMWAILSFTTIGRRIYAVGGNAEAARLSGISVGAYKLGAFALSAAAAGFCGVLFACRFGAINPTAMQGSELTVIAAAILGGTSLFGGAGSVVKTVAGALLLFALTNGFNLLDLGANYQGLIEGTVVIVAAAIYTVGGTKRARPVKGSGPAVAARDIA